MNDIDNLFENNTAWAEKIKAEDPGFFKKLAEQQSPRYLWIGCADSRVPANEIVGMLPGELFVHRNVANVVHQTDLNCLSVIQYAVEYLKVEHIIVCGHYGCGGVKAAYDNAKLGLIDNWLRSIRRTFTENQTQFVNISDPVKAVDRLCELNVVQQVKNVARTTMVEDAWERGQNLTIHGFIYGIDDGKLKNLDVSNDGSK